MAPKAVTGRRRKFVMQRFTSKRDKAILLTLLDTGLRASELCALRVEDVDMKSGRVSVRPVSFSPDGKYIISGGCDQNDAIHCAQGSARIWKATTGREIARLTYDSNVNSVAFSPDGKYVASGGCNQGEGDFDCTQASTSVWDAISGQKLIRMLHDDPVNSVVFSPDGRYIVSGGDDGILHVRIWRPADLITESCSRAARNLTEDEWTHYIKDAIPYQAVCPDLPIESEAIITSTP